jgi:hypothetical protein
MDAATKAAFEKLVEQMTPEERQKFTASKRNVRGPIVVKILKRLDPAAQKPARSNRPGQLISHPLPNQNEYQGQALAKAYRDAFGGKVPIEKLRAAFGGPVPPRIIDALSK